MTQNKSWVSSAYDRASEGISAEGESGADVLGAGGCGEVGAEDHAARAIWEFVGRLDLSGYYQAIESSAELGGRPAFDPQLLIRLWVYAYSVGIGSARAIARRCEWDPGFQWLTGGEVVNYHTLAEVRVEWRAQLDETFSGPNPVPRSKPFVRR